MPETTQVILPTAELIQRYREEIACLTDLHLDWDMLASFLTECMKSPDDMFVESDGAQETDADDQSQIEFKATQRLVAGLGKLLVHTGFWETAQSKSVRLLSWVGDDMLVKLTQS